ncbi:MAG: hypothetical protein QGH44_03260 [Arenicellales bacterium]|nr:hypothetical protein [Arenicellales bacterium]
MAPALPGLFVWHIGVGRLDAIAVAEGYRPGLLGRVVASPLQYGARANSALAQTLPPRSGIAF